MQATIRKAYTTRFQRELKVGKWKNIDTFTVASCSEKYKLSKLNYKISFTKNTEVMESDSISDSSFLELADFVHVKDKTLDENVLIGKLFSLVAYLL